MAAASDKLGTAQLLYQRASLMGLKPAWVSPGGLFAITTDSGRRYVNSGCSVFNSHTSVSLAKNKYFTRLICEEHGLPNIPFARPKAITAAAVFLDLHGKIIAKPVSGSGARDIHIIETIPELMELTHIENYILEKYVAGKEMRYLILNGTVIGVHHSEYGVSVQEDRMLERISLEPTDWDSDLMELALRTAKILDLKFAAVDFIITANNQAYILEVNTAPGFKWFHAPTSGPVIDVAGLFLTAMIKD